MTEGTIEAHVIAHALNRATKIANMYAFPKSYNVLDVERYATILEGAFWGLIQYYIDDGFIKPGARGHLAGINECFWAVRHDKKALTDCINGVEWPVC